MGVQSIPYVLCQRWSRVVSDMIGQHGTASGLMLSNELKKTQQDKKGLEEGVYNVQQRLRRRACDRDWKGIYIAICLSREHDIAALLANHPSSWLSLTHLGEQREQQV